MEPVRRWTRPQYLYNPVCDCPYSHSCSDGNHATDYTGCGDPNCRMRENYLDGRVRLMYCEGIDPLLSDLDQVIAFLDEDELDQLAYGRDTRYITEMLRPAREALASRISAIPKD